MFKNYLVFEPLIILSVYLFCYFDLIFQFQYQDGEGEVEVIRIQKVQLTTKEHNHSTLPHRISRTHQSTLLALPLDLEEMEMSIDLAGKCLDHPYSNPDIPIRPLISIKLQLMLLHRPSFPWQSFCKMSEPLFVYLITTLNNPMKN